MITENNKQTKVLEMFLQQYRSRDDEWSRLSDPNKTDSE